MKHAIVTAVAATLVAACAIEDPQEPMPLDGPSVPVEISGLPASYDPGVWVDFVLPGTLSCGAMVDAKIDVDPQQAGVQIVARVRDEQPDRPLRWIRVVSQEGDVWYTSPGRGGTVLRLARGANQITAVASDRQGFDVGQSNYCFVTLQ